MQKRTKILLAVSVLLAVLLLAAAGFLYYRTTPHYTLRHEHYADVTLDDGTVIRVIRRFKRDESGKEVFGVFGNELDVKEIRYIGSDTLSIPAYIGGFPVTGIGTYAAYPISCPGGDYTAAVDVNHQIKHLTLPDTITDVFMLNAGPFEALETLHMGKSTGDPPWILSNTLHEITVHPDNPRYTIVGGCLFDKNIGEIILEITEKITLEKQP